jgi:hypothetical protein
MKTIIGIGLIILGFITLTNYPNLGKDGAETLGAIIGVGLFTFLPGILLIKSANKSKSKE